MALTGWPVSTDDDGSGQTGTILNEAFFDAMEDALEAYLVDPGNPGTLPAEIIAEVIEARSGEASLDDRIDAVEAQIGSGAVVEADIRATVGSRNVVNNGDFEDWSNGDALAPNEWTLSGAGAAVAKTGAGEADTFTFGTTAFAAKTTRAGADTALSQDIVAAADLASFINIRGQEVALSAKVKAGLANQARLRITDGVTTTLSSFHTGGGTEEHLIAQHTISASATKLTIELLVLTSDGAVYWGGVQAIFSPFAPNDWQPLSNSPLASATRRGMVSVGAQEFSGVKTFLDHPLFHAGTSTTPAAVTGVIHYDITPVGNVGASGPDILMTYDIPAGVLSADGKAFKFIAWGNTANNANNKAWQAVVGGGTPITVRTVVHTNESWAILGTVIRTSNTTAICFFESRTAAAAGVAIGDHDIQTASIAGFNFDGATSTVAIQSTVSTANNDIVQSGLIIEVMG